MTELGTPVGIVSESWVYPFKGMRGVKQRSGLYVSSITVAGDRRYAYSTEMPDSEDQDDEYTQLSDEKQNVEQIPGVLDTIKFRGLLQYQPYFVNPDNPKTSKIRVLNPNGEDLSATSRKLREEIQTLYGKPLRRTGLGRGLYHSMPISLLSLETIAEIERLTGQPIDPQRFRENLLVKMFSRLPYEEDSLLGMLLQFGNRETSAVLTAVKKDPRCATVNFHPETAALTSGILRAIELNHDKNLGIYCSIQKEGDIKPGDLIYAKAA